MIYPRLSPNGRNVIGGNIFIEFNYKLIPPIEGDDKPYGTSPVWFDNNLVYYTYSRPSNKNDGMLVKYDFISRPQFTGEQSGNVLTAGGNRYAIWRPDIGVRLSNQWEVHPNWHSPALSDNGILAHGENNDGTINYAWGSNTVARELQPDLQIILDVANPNLTWTTFSPEPQCGKPIPVWTGKELLVLFQTHDGGVFLMEFSSKMGYVIMPRNFDGGSGYTHDAKALNENEIRVVSPWFDKVINLSTPRVKVPSSVQMPEPEEPPIEEPDEPNMEQLSEEVKVSLRRFFTKFPLVNGEDNIRKQVIKAAEQIAWEFPGDGYGTKRAAHGRPVTKDGISRKEGDTIHAWDLVTGAGTNNPKLNLDNPQYHDVSDQVFIGIGDDLDGGEIFIPNNHIGTSIPEPEPEPNPGTGECSPVVPGQDVIRDSLIELRNFCKNYVAPANSNPEYAGTKPYINDQIDVNGLYIGDGLIYFMMSDTGLWAKILMDPVDTRPWNEKRIDADQALQTYMRRRVGDNS